MAARSGNIRRGTTPATLPLSSSNLTPSSSNVTTTQIPSTHTKYTISVEEWERKAPLSDLQLRSVTEVMKAAEKLPMPLKFAEEPGTATKSPPGTPTSTWPANKFTQQQQSSRPGTPNASQPHGVGRALHPSHPVQTPQQFYDWFALIDRSVAHSQEAHYRAHLATLEDHLHVCDVLEKRITEVEKEVDDMMEGWRSVEEGGKSLKGACERLLEERDDLLALMEDIGGHLEFFQQLDHATRMLNHPGESLIFQVDFLDMVNRVDICIEFLRSHRHYREAEVYLLRFQQCMTRAMTLIKMNFVGSFRALASEISKRLSERDVSSTAQYHLLYTRFKSVSVKVAPLLGELERRSLSYPDELSALLAECHSAYFSTRKALLIPRLMEEIRGLDPERSDLVELTREGCGYLKQLCTEEWALYREFFVSGQDLLYQYLETLCDLLYDDLRPRILHEPRLTVLCEVCTVLQALMVLDASSASTATSSDANDSDSTDDTEDTFTFPEQIPTTTSPSQVNHNRVGKRLHISHLLKMVLQDAQTRLFFKAQAVIQSDIRHYVPNTEDLAWPDILVSANKPPTGTEIVEKESTSQIFNSVPALKRKDTWYPTLRTTVWVLSQLHDFVKPAIFEDIAQEALSYSRTSLIAASDLIRSRNPPGTHLDGSLFLARHLLILKEVMTSLEELRAREEGSSVGAAERDKERKQGLGRSKALEFSGIGGMSGGVLGTVSGGAVTETLTNMLSKTTSLLPEGFFASLGVTRGVESDMRGVKLDIDHSLRKACEDVIAACANPICDPLDKWVASLDINTNTLKSSTSLPPASALPPPPVTDAPTSSLQALKDQAPTIHLQFLEALQRDLRSGIARVRLYLEDERMVRVLVGHVVEHISGTYERWGEAMTRMQGGTAGAGFNNGQDDLGMLSSSRMREVLRDVCGDAKI